MGRKYTNLIFLFLILPVLIIYGQTDVRTEFNLPDILGYKTLKCDLHMHTVFSDGKVWPSIRAEEAWRVGLDAIAITDHIEHTPYKGDMNINYNRSYEIAKAKGDELGITVIRGGEITRGMPPGHCNAIFLSDVEKLHTENWRDAFKAAKEQDAFIFWNHPGSKAAQPDGIPRWYEEHTYLYENGMMDGIEIVNWARYWPIAHQWCIDKNLTMLSNSDSHEPLGTEYELYHKETRSFTVVFAKDKSEESIKDALKNRRTVGYWNNNLAGEEKYLKEIFNKSISINESVIELKGRQRKYLRIKNNSDIDYELSVAGELEELTIPEKITLVAGKTVLFKVGSKLDNADTIKEIGLPYIVENLYSEPGKAMHAEIKVTVKFIPTKS